MTRTSGLFAVTMLALAGDAGRGSAQPAPGVGAPPRPVVSPYLNLARRDVNPALNYYGIVRPQLATNNAIQSFQQQLGSLRLAESQPDIVTGLPVTGQPVYFLNTGSYFLNYRAGGGPVNPAMTTRQAPAAPPAASTPGRPAGRSR